MERIGTELERKNKDYHQNQKEISQRAQMMRNNIDFRSNGRIQQQYLHKPYSAQSFIQSPNEQMDSVTREKILAQKKFAEQNKIL